MESNGESNKIQISEATANLIKHAGKGYGFVLNSGSQRTNHLLNILLIVLLTQTLVNASERANHGQRERLDANVLVRSVGSFDWTTFHELQFRYGC
jgi:hypothetical protein